jgi:hypothetical protein
MHLEENVQSGKTTNIPNNAQVKRQYPPGQMAGINTRHSAK